MCDDDVNIGAIMTLLHTDPSWFYVTSVTLRYWGNDYPATAQYAGRLSPRVKRRKEKFSATSTSTQKCTFCAEKAAVEKARITGQTNCQHLKANDH